MQEFIEKFKSYPASVKNAFIYQVIAWIWWFIYCYTIYSKGKVPVAHVFSGIAICYFIISLKPWGRILAITCNLLFIIVLLQVSYTLYMYGSINTTFVFVTTDIVLFAISAYYLFKKETAVFFKAMNPKPEPPKEEK